VMIGTKITRKAMLKEDINPYSQMMITNCGAFCKNLIGFLLERRPPPFTDMAAVVRQQYTVVRRDLITGDTM
jgi:hypothetical protein